ncbi:MAG: Gfo/Idh/MocA family oxidoreductase [Chloroflexi bacterium]|nr:Gfo/Idh/MocA family oxidoreductase [Chloroflexota bacterium]
MVIKTGFIGAGTRANGAHYPAVARIEDARIEAICDLDAARLAKTADKYGVERRYADYHRMLAEVDLDVVYVIMAPQHHVPIVLDCLNAGKHVLVEKPPAMSVRELETMIETAERNGCLTAVGFQRRYAPVAQEVRRLVLERGPITMCIGEFHKNMLGKKGPSLGVSTLLDDIIHVADFVCYMCGGDPVEVHATQDRFFADWKNCYNGLVRFSSGAVGIVSGNRSSGARVLRAEVHGNGIAAYLDIPERAVVWADNAKEPTVLTGAELVGSANEQDYEGTLSLHRHLLDCIKDGHQPLTSFQACLPAMRLVEQMEGA